MATEPPTSADIQTVIDRMDRRTRVAKWVLAGVLACALAVVGWMGWLLDRATDTTNLSNCARAVSADLQAVRDDVSAAGWRGLKALGTDDDAGFERQVQLLTDELRELDALPDFDEAVDERC